MNTCNACLQVIPSQLVCGKCYSVSYCNESCQAHDWNSHHQFICGKRFRDDADEEQDNLPQEILELIAQYYNEDDLTYTSKHVSDHLSTPMRWWLLQHAFTINMTGLKLAQVASVARNAYFPNANAFVQYPGHGNLLRAKIVVDDPALFDMIGIWELCRGMVHLELELRARVEAHMVFPLTLPDTLVTLVIKTPERDFFSNGKSVWDFERGHFLRLHQLSIYTHYQYEQLPQLILPATLKRLKIYCDWLEMDETSEPLVLPCDLPFLVQLVIKADRLQGDTIFAPGTMLPQLTHFTYKGAFISGLPSPSITHVRLKDQMRLFPTVVSPELVSFKASFRANPDIAALFVPPFPPTIQEVELMGTDRSVFAITPSESLPHLRRFLCHGESMTLLSLVNACQSELALFLRSHTINLRRDVQKTLTLLTYHHPTDVFKGSLDLPHLQHLNLKLYRVDLHVTMPLVTLRVIAPSGILVEFDAALPEVLYLEAQNKQSRVKGKKLWDRVKRVTLRGVEPFRGFFPPTKPPLLQLCEITTKGKWPSYVTVRE